MNCVQCDLPLEDELGCPRCEAGVPAVVTAPATSHKRLASTVRRLKGLVLLSVLFGLFVAPFALYIASKALADYREAAMNDPSIERQLTILRRIALGLLVFWGVIAGLRIGAIARLSM